VSAAEVPAATTQMSAATLLAGPDRLLLLRRDERFDPQMFTVKQVQADGSCFA
jgi:hypothetical protein